ncbi:MAG: type II toxin-antitoxin system PemK/MazF family toxin [Burkholderiales bacterium]
MPAAWPRRGEVWWVSLDPARGREMSKRRPALVVSPDEMNLGVGTVIVAPITTTIRPWPTRYTVRMSGKLRSVALDQIRVVDRSRLTGKIADLDPAPALDVLQRIFAP